ncbi:MAG: beta-lactamase family protein [Bacteroidia bacterium]|nr:beta-lactamase family protein [Bacteroidia bacterium]
MRVIYLFGLFLFLMVLAACKKDLVSGSSVCTSLVADSSANHPKAAALQMLLNEYVKQGLPGIALLIHDSNGTFTGSAGKADIAKGVNFEPCHVSKAASITKLFMGVLALKLVEEGKLELDKPIKEYLPSKYISAIHNADKATVRQLMNHSAGIYDVIKDQGFYLAVLNNPNKHWTQDELLEFVYNKPAQFACGTKAQYSNTNTLLMSLVIEYATGRKHYDLLHEKVIWPLGLTNTYYHYHDALPSTTAQGYFDLYNNHSIVNVSNYITGSGNGYGGLHSNVFDLYTFLDALLVKKTLLQPATLQQMKTFAFHDENTGYGLGMLEKFGIKGPGNTGIGHTGRDLGYSADLFYFEKNGTIMCFLINYGTDGQSNLREVFRNFESSLVDIVLQ